MTPDSPGNSVIDMLNGGHVPGATSLHRAPLDCGPAPTAPFCSLCGHAAGQDLRVPVRQLRECYTAEGMLLKESPATVAAATDEKGANHSLQQCVS